MATGAVKYSSNDIGVGLVAPDDYSTGVFVHHTALIGRLSRSSRKLGSPLRSRPLPRSKAVNV
jgi:hypothetical protein